MAFGKLALLAVAFKSGFLGGPTFPSVFACVCIAEAIEHRDPGAGAADRDRRGARRLPDGAVQNAVHGRPADVVHARREREPDRADRVRGRHRADRRAGAAAADRGPSGGASAWRQRRDAGCASCGASRSASRSARSASRSGRCRATSTSSARRPTTSPTSIGAIFFTAAAFIQLRLTGRWRRGAWRSRADWDDWWAAAVQFIGTLCFNVTTIAALSTHPTVEQANSRVWAPDAIGSACFLIASALAILATTHREGLWDPEARNWWSTWLNMAGSVAFGASAIASYVAPDSGEALDTRAGQQRHVRRRDLLPGRRAAGAPTARRRGGRARPVR